MMTRFLTRKRTRIERWRAANHCGAARVGSLKEMRCLSVKSA